MVRFWVRIPKNVPATFPQAHVDVAGIAGFAWRIFGHEGNRFAVLFSDFFYALLKEDVHVGHGQRLGVAEIDFVLAAAPLAFAAFDRHAGSGHAVADRAHERFIARGLQDVVINAIITGGLEVAVAAGEGRVIGLVEEIELQFAGAAAGKALLFEQLDLAAKD